MCAIPDLNSVKWQQFMTLHEALMAVLEVADAIQTTKVSIMIFALAA
jgi:hypothetical protein